MHKWVIPSKHREPDGWGLFEVFENSRVPIISTFHENSCYYLLKIFIIMYHLKIQWKHENFTPKISYIFHFVSLFYIIKNIFSVLIELCQRNCVETLRPSCVVYNCILTRKIFSIFELDLDLVHFNSIWKGLAPSPGI